jgi:hypothetical protein
MISTKLKKNFQQCKKDGDKGEKLVKKIFEDIGFKCIPVSIAERLFYDLNIQIKNTAKFGPNYITYKIEVKYDYYFTKSGNIAIEVYNTKQKKKSGLAITKADFWIHILDKENIYITNVCILKDFCRRNKPLKIIDGAGDNNSRLYIYRFEDIKDIFTNIYKKSKRSLLRILNDVF